MKKSTHYLFFILLASKIVRCDAQRDAIEEILKKLYGNYFKMICSDIY